MPNMELNKPATSAPINSFANPSVAPIGFRSFSNFISKARFPALS